MPTSNITTEVQSRVNVTPERTPARVTPGVESLRANTVRPSAEAAAKPPAIDPERSDSAGGGAGISHEELTEAVTRLNDLVQPIRRELHFSVDDSTGETIIRVIDAETQELIRQIPPEEVLTLMQHLEQQDHRSLLMDVEA